MVPDKRPYPMDIGLLGAYAVVQIANALAQLIEHFYGPKRRQRSSAAFHGYLILDKTTV